MSGRREWVRVSHSPGASGAGRTTVTVTLQEGNLTAKWAVKTYANTIKAGVLEARKEADRALTELQEAVG